MSIPLDIYCTCGRPLEASAVNGKCLIHVAPCAHCKEQYGNLQYDLGYSDGKQERNDDEIAQAYERGYNKGFDARGQHPYPDGPGE